MIKLVKIRNSDSGPGMPYTMKEARLLEIDYFLDGKFLKEPTDEKEAKDNGWLYSHGQGWFIRDGWGDSGVNGSIWAFQAKGIGSNPVSRSI